MHCHLIVLTSLSLHILQLVSSQCPMTPCTLNADGTNCQHNLSLGKLNNTLMYYASYAVTGALKPAAASV